VISDIVDVNRISSESIVGAVPPRTRWVVRDSARRHDETDRFDAFLHECASCDPESLAQFVALPPSSRPDMIDRLRAAQTAGACRLVRLCPGTEGHGYPLSDWVLSPLPEVAERLSLSLAIDYGDASTPPPWADIYRFVRAYPDLAIVLLGVALHADLTYTAVLDAAPNVIVDTSRAGDGACVAQVVRRFGNHRVVLGSGHGDGVPFEALMEALDATELAAVTRTNAAALQAGTWREEYL
jgi:predicted TIM-barrel fold metal-dependent hydrolase